MMKMESIIKRMLSALLVCAMLIGMLPQLSVAVNSVEPSTEPGSTTQSESVNLITNGGFETWTADTKTQDSAGFAEMIATGWQQYYTGVTMSKIAGRNGSALKIETTTRFEMNQTIPAANLEGGKNYLFTGYIKALPNTTVSCQIFYKFTGGTDNDGNAGQAIYKDNTSEYKPFAYLISVPEGNTKALKITVKNTGNSAGGYILDDFSLTEIDVSENLIWNGGFEDYTAGEYTTVVNLESILANGWKGSLNTTTEVVTGGRTGHALKLKMTADETASYPRIYFDIPYANLKKGAQYRLTYWMKVEEGATVQFVKPYWQTSVKNANNKYIGNEAAENLFDNSYTVASALGAAALGDWTKVEYTITIPDITATSFSVCVYAYKLTAGAIYLDDISLVEDIPVTSVELNKEATTLEVGSNETLTATVLPDNAVDKTVTWSSDDETVATVVDGVVTAVAPGTATITATAGDKTDTCVVTVEEAVVAVESITLNKGGMALKVGDTQALTATVLPENATNKTVTWSSNNPDVATINNGTVTAVAPGVATITATAGGKSITCVVTVTAANDNNLVVNGGMEDFTVTDATNTSGTGDCIATDWNINGTAIRMEIVENGRTGHALKLTNSDSDTAHSFELTQIVPGLTEGKQYRLTAYVKALEGTASGKWCKLCFGIDAKSEANEGQTTLYCLATDTADYKKLEYVVTVPENEDAGDDASLHILLKSYNLTTGGFIIDDISLTKVESVPVTGVELNKNTLALVEGSNETLTATVSPDNADDKTVTWESDDNTIATVDSNGKVTAVAPGTTTITATAGEKSATCTVTVSQLVIPVTGITLDKDSVTLTVGDNETLVPAVTPENATNKTITWESEDEDIATVDANGKITAVAPGTTTITATCNGVSDTCTVTVNAIPVASIGLNKAGMALKVGENQALTATVLPEDATNKTVTWSSNNPDVATINNGTVTAVAPGVATITATAGGKSITCVVTVTVADNNLVANGGMEDFTVTVLENDTNKSEAWTSSIATGWRVYNEKYIRQEIVAGRNGYALKLTNGDSATGHSFEFSQTVSGLTGGKQYRLTAYVKALEGTVSGKWCKLFYKVNGTGAENGGETILYCNAGDTSAFKKLEYVITIPEGADASLYICLKSYLLTTGGFIIDDISLTEIVPVPAASVTLNKSTVSLIEGNKTVLTATVSPEETTDKTVTWTSSNNAVATVVDGEITAVAPGTATITATCGTVSASCTVTVEAFDGNYLFNGGFEDFTPGKFEQTANGWVDINAIGWKQYCSGVATEVVTGGRTDHALKITSCDKSVGLNAELKYVIPAESLVPGGAYVLSGYMKALEGTTPSDAWIAFRYNLGPGPVSSALVLPTDTDWKQVTQIIRIPYDNTADLIINIKAYRVVDGGFLVDDMSLVQMETTEVTSVTLNKTEMNFYPGESESLTATVLPDNATFKDVTWTSSDENVAVVDENGKVTAVAVGTAVITATSGRKSATCTAKVTIPDGITLVDKVELNKNGILLQVGDTADLTATVKPIYATDKTVTFTSSNTAVAAVDANGRITAIAAGTAVITAKSGDKTATCTVSISADGGLNMIPNGGFEDFKGGAFEQTKVGWTATGATGWNQYDAGVSTEIVPGGRTGNAMKLSVHAETGAPRILYTVPAEQIVPGATYKLTFWLKADADTAMRWCKSFWTLTSPKVSNENNGAVLKVTAGLADWTKVVYTIEVPENNVGGLSIYVLCYGMTGGAVYVDDISLVQIPQTVTLPKEEAFMEVGDTISLPAAVGPDTVLDKRVVYSTSDDAVATVDANGKVTAISVGTAIIKATPVHGGPSGECVVYVVADYVALESMSMKSATSLQTGGREQLTVTFTPANPSSKKLTWSSSDESVVSVAADGQLTALGAGTATITVTGEGGKTAQCVVTVTNSTTLSTTAVQLSIPFGKTYEGDFADYVTNNTGAEVKYSIYQNTQMGTLKINTDGTFTYLPRPNFDTTKTDSFIVLVTAGGQSALLEGVISVDPVVETIRENLVEGTTLMISREELAAIKAEIAKAGTLHNKIWKKYEPHLKSLLSWRIPQYEDYWDDEDARLYADWQRPVGTSIEQLLFAYLLTDDEAYKAKAIEAAVTSANYYAWAEFDYYDQAFLSAGHQGFAISLVYNWLRDDLTEQQRNDIVRRLYQTCERVRGRGDTSTFVQNCYYVANSAMNAASMALYQHPEDVIAAMQGVEGYEGLTEAQVLANCESWIAFGIERASSALELLPQDGTNYEGPGYHQYGLEYMLKSCMAFYKALDVDMFTNAKWFENSSQFYSAVMVPVNGLSGGNSHLNYMDCGRGNWYGPSHLYRTLAAIYQDPTAQWIAEVYEEKNAEPAGTTYWMSLFYMDPSLEAVSPVEAGRPTLYHAEDMDIVISRTNWLGDEAMVFMRSGMPVGKTQSEKESYEDLVSSANEGHNDADSNGLILYYNGEYLLKTDGYTSAYTGNYSTLMVDGKGQLGDGMPVTGQFSDADFHKYNARPYIKKTESTATYDYFVGDSTDAYNPELGLTKFERNVILLKEDNVLLVLDDIMTVNPEMELELRWFPESKIVTETYGIYTIYGAANNMKFFPFTTEGVTTEFKDLGVYLDSNVMTNEQAFQQIKTGSEWQNAVAFSWSEQGEEQAIVRYLCSGNNIHKFEVNGKIYTVDIKKNTVSMESGSLGIVDPWADNSKLSNVLFNGTSMEGFDSETLTYNVERFWKVPNMEILPVAVSPTAEVEMDWNGECPGTVTITVTSQDRSSVSTYVINLTNDEGLLSIAGVTTDAGSNLIQYTYDNYLAPTVGGKTWAASGCLPTVIYDMGRLVDISKIDIAFNASSLRSSYYDLYTSVDGQTWTLFVKDQMAPKTPAEAGYHTYTTVAEDVGQARYVKIYLRGFTTGDTYGDGLDVVGSYKGFQEISIYGSEVEPNIIVEGTTATVTGTGMSNAITAAGTKNEVVLDVESADDSAVKVILPVEKLKEIAEDEKSLTVQTGQATVTFDNAALTAITAAAGNKPTVELIVIPVDAADLEDAQTGALEDYDVAAIFAVTLVCEGQEISTFGSGKVTVRIPFTPAEGTLASEYRIAYISDDGDIEILETVSGDGYLETTLEHFSDYAIVRILEEVPATGDKQMVLLLAVVTLSCVTVLAVLMMYRKRYF